MQLFPIRQSCATCTYAISKQFLPITVLNLSVVPRLMVTYSRITVLSPMCVSVFSPENLRSCDMEETDAPGYTFTFLPKREPSQIMAFGPIHDPSSMTTSFWTVAK